jgi:uncharacterized protein (DUF488 family)
LNGKIITCSLREINQYEADIKYFIVLRPGKVKMKGFKHRPDLAPSAKLLDWAHEHMNEPGWFEEYTCWFNQDIKQRQGLAEAISEIEQKAKTQTILLACFCADVNVCHRGLIADELSRRGVKTEKH